MTLIFLALLPLAVGHLPNYVILGLLILIMTVFTTLPRDCHLFVVALDDGHRAAGTARPVFKP